MDHGMNVLGPGTAFELSADVERHLGYRPGAVRIFADTSAFSSIDRGDALELGGRYYLVTGTVREEGLGLDEQPKYWVKRAVLCGSGAEKIVKLVFLEQFDLHFGESVVRCFRSPAKEARVLDRVRRHPQFMTGTSLRDRAGNNVRVIDVIPGPSLEHHVGNLPVGHEEYFHREVPALLWRFLPCLEGLRFLHEHGERHGDVRPDHIILDRNSGLLRWIDYDYDYDYPEAPFGLDILGAGHVLAFIVGQGVMDRRRLLREPGLARTLDRIGPGDHSVVDRRRVVNLGACFRYIPASLNRVLMHFSAGAEVFYERIAELAEDLGEALSGMIAPAPGEVTWACRARRRSGSWSSP
ncbi:MAG: hypothetical protein HY907_21250 [Deltaproteobacteria bacterium]|nr:hypothetical protein [Deltaproteobacteria bacterium]